MRTKPQSPFTSLGNRALLLARPSHRSASQDDSFLPPAHGDQTEGASLLHPDCLHPEVGRSQHTDAHSSLMLKKPHSLALPSSCQAEQYNAQVVFSMYFRRPCSYILIKCIYIEMKLINSSTQEPSHCIHLNEGFFKCCLHQIQAGSLQTALRPLFQLML